MFPIVYDATLDSVPTNNGYGVLSDCLSCVIKEELYQKGATAFPAYTLELTCPLDGLHTEYLERGNLLYAQRKNDRTKQLFRIKDITIDRITRTINVFARHVSRDLAGYWVRRGGFSYTNINSWINFLRTQTFYDTPQPFAFINDRTTSGVYELPNANFENPQNLLDLLLFFNKMTNINYPLEYEFDNFDVHFKNARGNDNYLEVRYGKNLISFETEETTSDLPYAVVLLVSHNYTVNEIEYTQTIYGNLTGASDYDVNNPAKRAYEMVDVTDSFPYFIPDSGRPSSMNDDVWNGTENIPLGTALADYSAVVAEEKRRERLLVDEVTIDFNYIDFAEKDYWGGIERERIAADLGDYVTVVYPELGLRQKTEIMAIEYDVLNERYNTITAGQLRPNLSQTIKQIAKS